MLARLASKLHTATLDLLYPPGCAACDALIDGGPFCVPCATTLTRLDRACLRCALPASPASICRRCVRQPPPFDEARSAFAFGGALADALRLLKFSARTDLAAPLGRLLSPLIEAALAKGEGLVVPVPLSRQRLATRGYNQAALLALSAAKGAWVSTASLFRTRETPQQVGQPATSRREAMAGAFLGEPRLVAGRRIILVDDVMTTGATLGACAEALRAAGAVHILALTVARALP